MNTKTPHKPDFWEHWVQEAQKHGHKLSHWSEIDPLIERLYYELGSSTPVSEIFGVHRRTIIQRLHNMGARMNPRGGYRQSTARKKQSKKYKQGTIDKQYDTSRVEERLQRLASWDGIVSAHRRRMKKYDTRRN